MTRMFDPPHPGLIVAGELEYLQIRAEDFAKRIDVDLDSISKILRGQAPITPDIADRLAKTLTGPDAAMWLRMQAKYDAWQSEHTGEASFDGKESLSHKKSISLTPSP